MLACKRLKRFFNSCINYISVNTYKINENTYKTEIGETKSEISETKIEINKTRTKGNKTRTEVSKIYKYKFKSVGFKQLKLISFIIIFLLQNITFTDNLISNAEIPIPDKLRIGLYYETTALSNFAISAQNGLTIGSVNNNIFSPIYIENSSGQVAVRKDSYFNSNNNKLTEYKPTDKSIPAGDKLGPVHIQIGNSYQDFSSANDALTSIKTTGIAAYLAFVDSWQIWFGFYVDQSTAQTDISSILTPILPGYTFNVVSQTTNRIVVSKPTGETAFIIGSDTNILRIKPNETNSPYIFKLNNNDNLRYRGELEVRRFTGSDMTLINIVPTEQYLYGVVPAEIGSGAGPEALKAQAVAARTYLLNNQDKHKKYDFQLCSTTNCQVYKGFSGEYSSTNKAVDDTAGKKLTYNGKLAEIFYFSSSGGMTEDAKNVWGTDIPYLKSVEDKYENTNSYHYNWETTLTSSKIKEIMLGRGYDLGDMKGITVTKTSDAGRVTELVISGTKSQRTYKLDGCRTVFGFDSQWYVVTSDAQISIKKGDNTVTKTMLGTKKVMTAKGVKDLTVTNGSITVIGANGVKKTVAAVPTSYKFTGKGWGHAVGMSQEGAIGMAKAGFKYDQILQHYFQGTVIE
ncbi:MAG: SpoIID/LytB domain-containing protein [Bacillota bacterium]|nr:SpoIID/LytB domain-containing protein [Bacillota bacterium]